MKKLQNAMNLLRSYTLRVPMWLRLLFIIGAFVVPLYWAVTFTGVYALLSEWQANLLGEYYMLLSYLASVLFLLLPALAIILVIALFFPELDPKTTKNNKNIF
jgi:hypothetical protein